MVTRRVKAKEKPTMKKEEEEERWRQLFPDIKKCVILIPRQNLDRLDMVKLKHKQGEGGRRPGSPQPGSDWMEPLELDNNCGDGRLRRFVKKVEVKVQENNTTANGSRRRRGKARGSDVLRLSADVITADPTHCRFHRQESWKKQNKRTKSVKDEKDNIISPGVDHNYSLNAGGPDTPDRNSQSSRAR